MSRVESYWVLQGLVFAIVGFAAGIIGTATSNVLLAVRKRLDSSFESQNKAPNVLLNAGVWATHMGVSSNIRYQMLNGLDMVRCASRLWPPDPITVDATASVLARAHRPPLTPPFAY